MFIRRIFLAVIVLSVIIVSLMFIDFSVNRNTYEEEVFYKEIYFNEFLGEYLGFWEHPNDAKNRLLINECEHSLSIKNKKFNNKYYTFDSYNELSNFWFKKERKVKNTPELFNIYTSDFKNANDNVFIEISNFTPHKFEICIEEKQGFGWEPIDVKFRLLESYCDTLSTYDSFYSGERDYLKNNQKFSGHVERYFIETKFLSKENYRVRARLEEHKDIVSAFSLAKEIPVNWEITNKTDAELDSFQVKIKNLSENSFFYYSRKPSEIQGLKYDLAIYKKDTIEYIEGQGGFGCGTGVYLHCMKNNKQITTKIPYNIRGIRSKKREELSKFLEEFCGDSIGVRFCFTAITPIWSKYQSQDVFSEEIIIKTSVIYKK